MQAELPAAERVAQALERAYARPEFAPRAPGLLDPVREAIGRAWRWVGSLFEGVFSRADSPVVFWTLVVILVAAALAIVGYFLFSTLSHLHGGAPGAGAGGAPDAGGARARTAPEWDALAARLAREGRFREAALALYQSLLLRLEAGGALRYDPAKTPGDYRREARPHPQGRRLAAFLRGFEPVAFGGRGLAAEGYERLRAAAAGEGGAGGTA